MEQSKLSSGEYTEMKCFGSVCNCPTVIPVAMQLTITWLKRNMSL